MNQLTIEHLAPYLPHTVMVERKSYKHERFKELSAYDLLPDGEIENLRLILRPLTDLTKEINHRGETFIFTELFEIGDEDNNTPEFDHGNVKLIKKLEAIAEHCVHHDVQFLPYWVVSLMHKYMFDTSGLIESGLAISVHDLEFNPYEK